MRSEELDEGDRPPSIEGYDHPIIAVGNLEPHAWEI